MAQGRTFQSWNSRIKAYVKYTIGKNEKTGGKYAKFQNVKQKDPSTPFKGVPIKKRK